MRASQATYSPLLEAARVTRRFGGFVALDSVDFTIHAGEIHALLGENGAGKSTLMNILSGLLRPSDGVVRVSGKDVRFGSPSDAASAGIGMVHQHFLLVPTLSVAENLLLSADRAKGGPLSYPIRSVLDEAREIADRLGWSVPWETPAGALPVGAQQRVEILKALRGDTRVLIFDEPTAVLTPTETPELFGVLRRLASEGRGIVFISHKLDEVLALSQRVTVLRRGIVVARVATADATAAQLAEAMVGADSEAASMLTRQSDAATQNRPVDEVDSEPAARLTVDGLTLVGAGKSAKPLLDRVSFTVAPGEIFGIAGVDGNGQATLAECLSGLLRPSSGAILVDSILLRADPNIFRRAKVGVVPADRQRRGLALPMNITENLALGAHDAPAFRLGPLLLWPKLRARAAELIRRFDIRASGPDASAESLSGGNQQKVVIARALTGPGGEGDTPRVLIAVNPTRGLDVGAIAYVHDALRHAKRGGAAIVLISTELDEVIALSDRIGVLFDGRLVGVVSPGTPRETLGRMMGGQAAGQTESGS